MFQTENSDGTNSLPFKDPILSVGKNVPCLLDRPSRAASNKPFAGAAQILSVRNPCLTAACLFESPAECRDTGNYCRQREDKQGDDIHADDAQSLAAEDNTPQGIYGTIFRLDSVQPGQSGIPIVG